MDRGVTRRDVFGRRLLAAAAAAAVLSSFAGLYAVYTLREEYRVLNAAMRESAALLAAANSSEEALARCKSFMRSGGGALPMRPASANKFYSAVLESLSAGGLEGVRVSGAPQDGGTSFVISGWAEYPNLLQFLALLRDFPYLVRLSSLSFEDCGDGGVVFSAEISTIVSGQEA